MNSLPTNGGCNSLSSIKPFPETVLLQVRDFVGLHVRDPTVPGPLGLSTNCQRRVAPSNIVAVSPFEKSPTSRIGLGLMIVVDGMRVMRPRWSSRPQSLAGGFQGYEPLIDSCSHSITCLDLESGGLDVDQWAPRQFALVAFRAEFQ